jgi:basic membrane lipoprotein Med (substrate-binding protein (PBP1-ABC) superfamily)
MSVGLWDKDYDPSVLKSQMSAISAADLQTSLQSTTQGGMTDQWVTPSFLMSDAHWQVLKDFWSNQPTK